MVVANAGVGKGWAAHATGILAGLTAGLTCLLGALDLVGVPILSPGLSGQSRLGVDVGTIVTGFLAAALASTPVRQRIARVLPVDPDNPVHALAMVLAVVLFGTLLVSVAFTDVLAANQAQPPLTLADVFWNEPPYLVLAAMGVGIFIRRDAAETLHRLGFLRPAWWHVTLALAAAGAFFAFSQEADVLSHALTPDLAHRVDVTNQHLFGGLGGPVGIGALALLPGICEEALFRGALQPRIGLLATALLFTLIHTQYGLSFDTLAVFVIAIGLGLIRSYTNTTASATCHVSYNLLVGLGISGAVFGVTLAVALVLLAASGYGWSQWRRAGAAAHP